MIALPTGISEPRVLIVGAAREGCALARFLARCGASVTLSDAKPREALGEAIDQVGDADITWDLGRPMPDLEGMDVLFVSPGVPPTAPVVTAARQRALPISSEPRLFCQLCAAPVVGITGSSGKTTVTSLVGEMQRLGGRRAWVGGNIGAPLLERLLDEEMPDVAVMELSSFQLELFGPEYQGPGVGGRREETGIGSGGRRATWVPSTEGWSPHVAAVTNITPNHLDRHPSMADYARAKAQILRYQGRDDWAVLNSDNAAGWALAAQPAGGLLAFSLVGEPGQGAFRRGEALFLRWGDRERPICRVDEVRLRGEHNLANVLAAACCSAASGVEIEAIREAATTFRGVDHRLEPVRNWRDVLFVNDSIATSPERAMAALRSYHEPLLLLAGGRDKHLPWDEWADLALRRTRAVIAFGEAAPIVTRALEAARDRFLTERPEGQEPDGTGAALMPLHQVACLEDAVALSARLAQPGDVVLLSPGGTSFDAFRDFEERGRRFRELVAAL